MRPMSYVFAVFMLINGLLHIAGSLHMRELMPGVYSSPLLIAASITLIAYTRAYQPVPHLASNYRFPAGIGSNS